jgi:hypothetical protein
MLNELYEQYAQGTLQENTLWEYVKKYEHMNDTEQQNHYNFIMRLFEYIKKEYKGE